MPFIRNIARPLNSKSRGRSAAPSTSANPAGLKGSKSAHDQVDYFSGGYDANDRYLEANADINTLINKKLSQYLINYVDSSTTNAELREQIKEAFKILDVDSSGELSTLELITGIKQFGLNPNEDEWATIMNFLDTDRDGSVSFAEFTNVVIGEVPKKAKT